MFNNRKYINQLKADMENKENSIINLLEANKEFAIENEYFRNKINTLEKVIIQHQENECKLNKERITYENLYRQEYKNFEKAYELARKNRDKRSLIEKELKEEKEKNSKLKGQLDKLRNFCRMQTGVDILEGEE